MKKLLTSSTIKPKIAIIMGMHRSGTSAMGNLLHNFGFHFGDSLLEANTNNQKGYFENKMFLNINELIFKYYKYSWNAFLPLDESFYQREKSEWDHFKQLIRKALLDENFCTKDLLCIKDPRLCFLIPIWLDIFEEKKWDIYFINLIRHPAEVTSSLKKRDSLKNHAGNLLWLRHNLSLEKFTRGYKRQFIDYGQLIKSPNKVIELLSDFLDLGSNEDISQNRVSKIIDSTLKHNHNSNEPKNPLNASLWRLLQQITKRETTQHTLEIDKISNQLKRNFDSFFSQDIKNSYYFSNTINTRLKAQLFYDLGTGFNEKQSVIKSIETETTHAKFELPKESDILGLRLDPINCSSVIKIHQIIGKTPTQNINISFTHNGLNLGNDLYYFNTNDPILLLTPNIPSINTIQSVEIIFNVLSMGSPYGYIEFIKEEKKIDRLRENNLKNKLKTLEAEKEKTILDLNHRISDIELKYNQEKKTSQLRVNAVTQKLKTLEAEKEKTILKLNHNVLEIKNKLKNKLLETNRLNEDIKGLKKKQNSIINKRKKLEKKLEKNKGRLKISQEALNEEKQSIRRKAKYILELEQKINELQDKFKNELYEHQIHAAKKINDVTSKHQVELSSLKEDYEFLLRKDKGIKEELSTELSTLKKSISFQIGILITKPYVIIHNFLLKEKKVNRTKIWLWAQFLFVGAKSPFRILKHINFKNFKTLSKALSKESPTQIIDNFKKLINPHNKVDNKLIKVPLPMDSLIASDKAHPSTSSKNSNGVTIIYSNIERADLIEDKLIVSGWALAQDGIDRIDIYQKGEHIGRAKLNIPRFDVAKAHPTIPNNEYSGFEFYRDTSFNDEIEILIITKNGIRKSSSIALEKKTLEYPSIKKCLHIFDKKNMPSPVDQKTTFDIIIPVYNGYKYLKKLFFDIKENTYCDYNLIIIEDKSPDIRVRKFLKSIEHKFDEINIIYNEHNLGFVKSVNKGMSFVKNHFVILNTDVELPQKWLQRLMYPIKKNKNIASTTPFTNCGTICSFPKFLEDNDLFDNLSLFKIDNVFSLINPINYFYELPTGVGFCMGMNKNVFDLIGGFNAKAFGKGYGEENDWCRRAVKEGYKNVIVPNLFVYHKHGGSFNSDEKKQLVKTNLNRLNQIHPEYNAEVQKFIQENPYKFIRDIIIILLSCEKENIRFGGTIFMIDHNNGGGANSYRKKLITDLVLNNKIVLLVLFKPSTQLYELEFSSKNNNIKFSFKDLNEINSLIEKISLEEIFVNELVGFPNVPQWLDFIIELKNKYQYKITLPVHDFFAICPSYTLLNSQGAYCGVPDNISTCIKCIKNIKHININYYEIKSWRENWGKIIAVSDEIICFSNSSKDILSKAYPDIQNKCIVKPHKVDYIKKTTYWKRKNMGRNKNSLTIGVLGSINYQKGADVIYQLLDWSKKNVKENDIKIVIIGEMSYSKFELTQPFPNLKVTGRYNVNSLEKIVNENQIDVFIIPSVWPETFSYTTEEIIKMNYPLAVFNIGAPSERVIKYRLGKVIDIDASPAKIINNLRNISKI